MNALETARRAVAAAWGLPWRSVRVQIRRSGHRHRPTLLIGTSGRLGHVCWRTHDMGRREILRFAAEIGRDLIVPSRPML